MDVAPAAVMIDDDGDDDGGVCDGDRGQTDEDDAAGARDIVFAMMSVVMKRKAMTAMIAVMTTDVLMVAMQMRMVF